MDEVMSCENCEHWKLKHWGGREDVKGCVLWNNYKLFGKQPLHFTPYDSHIGFESLFDAYGPAEAFEGWVSSGGGMAYNHAILTKGDADCEYRSSRKS